MNEERMAMWIDSNSRSWNEVLVRQVVLPNEVQDVLQVPIPLIPRDDVLRWPFTRDRKVSVKSAYHKLRDKH